MNLASQEDTTMARLSKIILFLFLMMSWSQVQAQMELPAEELAKESVVPKFDNSTTVKSRNVVLDHKFETGVYYGWNFAEPIENQSKIGVNLGYHWDEMSSLFINYSSWISGLNNQYSSALYSKGLDFTRAPALQTSMWGNYEWNIFYGKISIAKQAVGNLSVYPIMGVGMTTYTNKSYYGVNGGIGTKFYFSPHWALRVDFKIQYSGQPSPFLPNILTSKPVPQPSDYQDTYSVGSILDVGLVAIF